MGADMVDVGTALNRLCSLYNIKINDVGGIYNLNLKDISSKIQCSFDSFSQSRFSIRDFGDSPLEVEKVCAALKLCERTPSACNRQSWRVHVYTENNLVAKMFELQGGSKGFNKQMQCAILVCGDLRNYGFYEQNLPFVDGGLYAMKQEMRIPSYEVPVLLIGVGTFKDDYKVAVSHRYMYKDYVKFNQ